MIQSAKLFTLYSTIFLFFASSQAWAEDISVSATYKVRYGGVSIGKFHLKTNIENNKYSVTGATKLKLLVGLALNWKMKVQSTGTINNNTPKPDKFGYDFRNKKKRKKKMQVTFAHSADGLTNVTTKIKRKKGKKYVPIKQEHLRNVYDPLSALVVLTHKSNGSLDRDVCNKTLRLFDGKERYNISFKFKKVKMVDIGHKTNKKAKTYICNLRYTPISGHRVKDKTKQYMSTVTNIEVWFSPLNRAGIYVPHLIKVPTPYGPTTTIQAKSFVVKQNGQKPIRFIR